MIHDLLFEDRDRGLRIELLTNRFDPTPGERTPRAERHFLIHVGGAKVALSAAQMIGLAAAFTRGGKLGARVLEVLRGEGVL